MSDDDAGHEAGREIALRDEVLELLFWLEGEGFAQEHATLAGLTPFLAFPPEVRRVIYTTNAIEALNRQLRKAIKTKGHFPNEDAARKLIYLAVMHAVPAWTRTRFWTLALLAFKLHFGDRLPD